MGVIDVLKNLPKILKNLNKTVAAILRLKPDIVISVDSFDFCYRVIKKFTNKYKAAYPDLSLPKIIHIVAPSVWLYKKDRAQKLSRYVDLLLTIVPDEEKYFTPYGLDTRFIGNPALYKDSIPKTEVQDLELKFQTFTNIHLKEIKNIAITIGSRKQEIDKHLKLIQQVITRLNNYSDSKNFDFSFKIFATPETEPYLQKHLNPISPSYKLTEIVSEEKYKNFLLDKIDFAIAKSGPNTFDFIFKKIPFLVYYKTSWFNVFVAFFFFKLKFANLLNIIANKPLIPEFLQHRATALNISNFVINFFETDLQSQDPFREYDLYLDKFKSSDAFSNPFKEASKHLLPFIHNASANNS
jgi:lipid-A-disaccharide synthase